MSVYDTTPAARRPVPMGAVAIFNVISGFERTVGRLFAWRNARATESALLKLSDSQLADIGLHRGEILEVAEDLARI